MSVRTLLWDRIAMLAAALLLAVQFSSAQTFTVLHDFTGGSDGSGPQAGLTLLDTSNLFGSAGDYTLFRMQQRGPSWIFNPIFEFDGTDGQIPLGRLSFGPGGALYGAAGTGGLPECIDGGGCGLIFSMRPPSSICDAVSCPWTESVVYQFDPDHHPDDGYAPIGSLTFDTSGDIFGATELGGAFNGGTLFELTRTQNGWVEAVLYSFGGQQGDGHIPFGNVILNPAGNLIGTTENGGNNDCLGSGCGVVYQLAHSTSGWTETILHTFSYATDGSQPEGGVITDAAGNLYGETTYGGPNNGGTVYELTPSGSGYSFQVLYAFAGNPFYGGPSGLLAMDSSGNLYGAYGSQGAYGSGSIYKLTRTDGGWVYSDLHDSNGTDGDGPEDGPTLDSSRNLYGTTLYGGTGSCHGGCGVVWEITP
jgi:uncharacterized repeat protein (TIGR03803 family)